MGTGTQLVAPLGYVAGGDKNSFYRSHLPGLGLHGQIGMLFLRRFGATLHAAKVEHLKGTDAQERGSSWQMGASLLYLFRPEEKTPYLELGLNRNSFSNTVSTQEGAAERSAHSWDTRVGIGYMVLTKAQKFLYTPWAAVDFGKFSSIEQTINGNERSIELGDNTAWHYVFNFGITFAYHKKVPALMGRRPRRGRMNPDNDLILAPNDKCPTTQEDYYPPNPSDGCPSDDWDQDKILNAVDKCPTGGRGRLGPRSEGRLARRPIATKTAWSTAWTNARRCVKTSWVTSPTTAARTTIAMATASSTASTSATTSPRRPTASKTTTAAPTKHRASKSPKKPSRFATNCSSKPARPKSAP